MPFGSYLTSLPADDALIASSLTFAFATLAICAIGAAITGRLLAPRAGEA